MHWLGIEGAWKFTPRQEHDDRGSCMESFRGTELAADLGYEPTISYASCSVSRRGVIRGIYYTDVPPGQAKYVTCVSGAVLDVVVDLRVGSPSLGQWRAVRLDERDREAVFLSEGLGHGFMALTEQATVMYLCSTGYDPKHEHGIDPLDPDLGITWPLHESGPRMSLQDIVAPTLAEAAGNGLLPSHADCLNYQEKLRNHQPLSPA